MKHPIDYERADWKPAEMQLEPPFRCIDMRSRFSNQRTTSLGDADRRTPCPPSVGCGIYSEAEPGGPEKARQSTSMEGSAMHQPGESPGTYIKPRHLLIASLCCWAVVAIIAGVLL